MQIILILDRGGGARPDSAFVFFSFQKVFFFLLKSGHVRHLHICIC